MRVKAWRIEEGFGLDNVRMVELADPEPGPGQVVVGVRACSLNFRDTVVVKGFYGRAVKAPVVLLSDGAGEVLAVGAGVTRVKVGDRVCGTFFQGWMDGDPTDATAATALGGSLDGMLSEKVLLSAEGVVRFPDHLSYEEASTLPCAALTAWNALFRSGGLRPGSSVLTLGTGGVSVFALQFARMAGARVISTSSSDAKLERMAAMGADTLVNYKSTPEWDKPVRAATGGVGVDHVVEVGGAGTLATSLKAVRRAGHIALIGVVAGMGEVDPRPVFLKSVRMEGIYVGSRAMFDEMNRAISLSGLKPVIDRVFGFGEVPAAFAHMGSGAHFGKICVSVG